jgi:hypothetical protein
VHERRRRESEVGPGQEGGLEGMAEGGREAKKNSPVAHSLLKNLTVGPWVGLIVEHVSYSPPDV